jgi:hypothetical protein
VTDEQDRSGLSPWYWGVDFPGLTLEEAKRIVEFAREELGLVGSRRGILIDPHYFYSAWVDRETAETLRSAFQEIGVESMVEIIDDWLSQAEP